MSTHKWNSTSGTARGRKLIPLFSMDVHQKFHLFAFDRPMVMSKPIDSNLVRMGQVHCLSVCWKPNLWLIVESNKL
jgi:hypothetical protein